MAAVIDLLEPTPVNVRKEATFLDDVHANVDQDAPTMHNVQSHLQYSEDPHYHTAANQQPFRHDFHQPVWSTSASLSLVRQVQPVPDAIYCNAADPSKNSKIKANIRMATMNPEEFAVLQESILDFVNTVQE